MGNSWDWQPSQKYDYVRTELVYVPIPFGQQYIDRLLTNVVSPNGTLIIAHYRSRTEDLTIGWMDELLAEWGYSITGITHGFNGEGLEQSRFVALRNA
ncbi:MAG: hypothetical protein AAFR81_23460 [Chloroflexota bacterium]